jgi:cytochrome c oxidase cbb3-type subunit 2
LLLVIAAVVTIGGIVEIAPLFYLENTIEKVEGMRPTRRWNSRARHLRSRRLLCLPFPDDPPVPRRGGALRALQLAAESMYDHPFQWGSKRTGPDLARVGDQIFQRMACAALEGAAFGGATIHHAQLSMAA